MAPRPSVRTTGPVSSNTHLEFRRTLFQRRCWCFEKGVFVGAGSCLVLEASRTVILGIYRQKAAEAPLSPESKAQILDLLHRTGALQATYDLIRQLGREVNKTVTELEAAADELNPALRGLVKSLSELPIPTSL